MLKKFLAMMMMMLLMILAAAAQAEKLPTAAEVVSPLVPTDIKECAAYKLRLDAQRSVVDKMHQSCLNQWNRSEKAEFAGGPENCTVMQCQTVHIALHRFDADSKQELSNCYDLVKLANGKNPDSVSITKPNPETASTRLRSTPPPKQDDFDDLLAISDELDQMDKSDFADAINEANGCTASRNFSCSETQLAKAGKLLTDSKSKQILADARQRLANERAEVAEEIRRAEEARQYALQQQLERDRAAAAAQQKNNNLLGAATSLLNMGVGIATDNNAMTLGGAVGLATGNADLGNTVGQSAAMLDAARNGGGQNCGNVSTGSTPKWGCTGSSTTVSSSGGGGNCNALGQQTANYAGQLGNVCTPEGGRALDWLRSNEGAIRNCGGDTGFISDAVQQRNQLCVR